MYQSLTKNPYTRAYPIPWGIWNGNKSTYTHEPLFHLYPPQPSYLDVTWMCSPLLNSSGHSSPHKNIDFLGVFVLLP